MKLDLVHDLQAVYRQVVDSMSRPGLIANVQRQAAKVGLESSCYQATLLLALLLLDTEVRFKVYTQEETRVTQLISRLTYAKAAGTREADFLFVLADAAPEDLAEAMTLAGPGDLLNPHKGATLIVETGQVERGGLVREAGDLVLTGPGIAGEHYIRLQTGGDWVERRAEKNREYPLGIEMIFSDGQDNILCLPRTTQIKRWSD